MIAAIAALLLLIVMFIFTWFSVDLGDNGLFNVDTGWNAWQAFSWIDLVLFVTIIVAVGGALVTAAATSVNIPVAVSAITTGLGILSFLLVLFRVISPPDFGADDFGFGDVVDTSRGIGVWLGLILTAAIAYGGWRAMEEEGTSFGDQADRFRGTGGTPPPPPPPPPPTDTGGSAPPPAH